MKVLLLEDVRGLGKRGEVCEVKDGYARNFLIAKNKALHATREVINRFNTQQKNFEEKAAFEFAEKKQLIQTLSEITLRISKKVGANKVLFGAVTKEEIVEELFQVYNLSLDRKNIEFNDAIKTLGIHEVEIKMGKGLSGILRVEVLPL